MPTMLITFSDCVVSVKFRWQSTIYKL